MTSYSVELAPEVHKWLQQLNDAEFDQIAAELGNNLTVPPPDENEPNAQPLGRDHLVYVRRLTDAETRASQTLRGLPVLFALAVVPATHQGSAGQ